jgi:glutathione S-transferase
MLRLVSTPLSHFTRKVRILLAELAVPYEMTWTRSVLAPDASAYGDNPLRRVPTLHVDGEMLIESDHIARWLVATHDPADRFGVRSERIADLNRLAVINTLMGNEAILLLTARGGVDPATIPYLGKLGSVITDGLAWLDAHLGEGDLDYRDIALVCLWQHLVHYKFVPDLERYPRIAARVTQLSSRPSISSTSPEASLAEARSAGWSPPS